MSSSTLLLSQTMTRAQNERKPLTVSSSLSPLSASSLYSLTLTRSGEIFIYLFLTDSRSHACVCVCVCVCSLSLRQEHFSYIMSLLLHTHSHCPKSVMSREAFIQLSSYSVSAYEFHRQYPDCLNNVWMFVREIFTAAVSRVTSHEHQCRHLLQLCHTYWGSHGNSDVIITGWID